MGHKLCHEAQLLVLESDSYFCPGSRALCTSQQPFMHNYGVSERNYHKSYKNIICTKAVSWNQILLLKIRSSITSMYFSFLLSKRHYKALRRNRRYCLMHQAELAFCADAQRPFNFLDMSIFVLMVPAHTQDWKVSISTKPPFFWGNLPTYTV